MKINRKHYAVLASTQDMAKDLTMLVKPGELTLITCETQTSGRGTQNKEWVSPTKVNIYATLMFVSNTPANKLPALSLFFSILLCRTLVYFGLAPSIKWPNDVLLAKKKVAGILTEIVTEADKTFYVVGLGLNVNMSQKDLRAINQAATSLLEITGKKWPRERLLKKFLDIVQAELPKFLQSGFSPYQKEFDSYSETKGKKIVFNIGVGPDTQGIHVGVDKEGYLILEQEDNQRRVFHSGSIKNYESKL